MNVAAREEHEKKADFGGQEDGWFFGFNARHRGSIHSDRWHGTAADLVDHDLVAVYPVVGWWRERRHLGRIDRAARYSLVVSIYSPDLDVNIYTPVRIMVEQPIEIEASSDPNEGQT